MIAAMDFLSSGGNWFPLARIIKISLRRRLRHNQHTISGSKFIQVYPLRNEWTWRECCEDMRNDDDDDNFIAAHRVILSRHFLPNRFWRSKKSFHFKVANDKIDWIFEESKVKRWAVFIFVLAQWSRSIAYSWLSQFTIVGCLLSYFKLFVLI